MHCGILRVGQARAYGLPTAARKATDLQWPAVAVVGPMVTSGAADGGDEGAVDQDNHPDAPDLTLNQAVEGYGNPMAFVLSTVLLSGGLVAAVGGADPDWLKQFDLTS